MKCAHCGNDVLKHVGHVNRANKLGMKLFCSKKCFGLDRRISISEKKELKRLYDIEYRNKNKDLLKSKKQAFNKTEAGRAIQKRNRDKRKDKHAEYINRPDYKSWKQQYDKVYRAKKDYGDFWEAQLILKDIEKQIEPERVQIKIQKGTYNKSQKRKRLWNSMQKTLKTPSGTHY